MAFKFSSRQTVTRRLHFVPSLLFFVAEKAIAIGSADVRLGLCGGDPCARARAPAGPVSGPAVRGQTSDWRLAPHFPAIRGGGVSFPAQMEAAA